MALTAQERLQRTHTIFLLQFYMIHMTCVVLSVGYKDSVQERSSNQDWVVTLFCYPQRVLHRTLFLLALRICPKNYHGKDACQESTR